MGSPMSRLVLDGMYGVRGDGCLTHESTEYRAQVSEQHRAIQNALNNMFAFWRPAAQGVTTGGPLAGDPYKGPHAS